MTDEGARFAGTLNLQSSFDDALEGVAGGSPEKVAEAKRRLYDMLISSVPEAAGRDLKLEDFFTGSTKTGSRRRNGARSRPR